MSSVGQCGLLIASLAMTGCREDRSANDMPARPKVTARHSADVLPKSGHEDVYGEEIRAGSRLNPFANPEAKAVVLIFVSTDCPIANRYAPELGRLNEAYQAKNVSFWLVYADPTETPEGIRRHIEEYRHRIPALRDPEHRLVRFCEASRTPEAVVFAPGGDLRYRGRIDDRFVDYGKSRKIASRHDLQEAIEAVVAGRPVPTPVTTAIGCHIPGVEK